MLCNGAGERVEWYCFDILEFGVREMSDAIDARITWLENQISAVETHLSMVATGAKSYRDAAGFTTLYEPPSVYRRELVELKRELADVTRSKYGLEPRRFSLA